MKRKLWLGFAVIALVFVMGTTAFALGNNGSFSQMLPFMKQMHPNVSDQQLEDMYNRCHQDGGVMQQRMQKYAPGEMMYDRT